MHIFGFRRPFQYVYITDELQRNNFARFTNDSRNYDMSVLGHYLRGLVYNV